MRRAVAVSLLAASGLASASLADVVAVDGKAAIFDAGRAAPTLDGVLPPEIAIPAGADYVYFGEVSGLVRAHPVLQWAGPDGNSATLNDTDINSYMGVSGIIHPRTLPLLAVFLGEAEPENPAPARLDFYALGSDFAELSPLAYQTFFVGDGLAYNGEGYDQQKFWIPAGATRMYLGLADAGYFTGDPGDGGGAYDDNAGSFSADVQFHIVPSAGPLALLGLAGTLGLGRRR